MLFLLFLGSSRVIFFKIMAKLAKVDYLMLAGLLLLHPKTSAFLYKYGSRLDTYIDCVFPVLPNWFHLQWSHNMQIFPIAVKELFPVVIAAAIYGNQWSGKLVQLIEGGQYCCSSGYSGHIQPRTPLNAPYSNTSVFCCPFQLLVLCFSCCRDK